jgi:hypothetical protein
MRFWKRLQNHWETRPCHLPRNEWPPGLRATGGTCPHIPTTSVAEAMTSGLNAAIRWLRTSHCAKAATRRGSGSTIGRSCRKSLFLSHTMSGQGYNTAVSACQRITPFQLVDLSHTINGQGYINAVSACLRITTGRLCSLET